MRISDWSSDVCSSDLLSVGGEVVGNNIRCPFHHWAYGDGGQCRHIPAGDEIPKRATLFHFASAEQFGLIWVFFGKKPLYELQTFEDFDEDKHVARSYQVQLSEKLNSEPWMSRSEEHTSELQSLMRSTYAVLCLKNNKKRKQY